MTRSTRPSSCKNFVHLRALLDALVTRASGMAVCCLRGFAHAFYEDVGGALDFAARLQNHAVRGFDGQRTDLRRLRQAGPQR